MSRGEPERAQRIPHEPQGPRQAGPRHGGDASILLDPEERRPARLALAMAPLREHPDLPLGAHEALGADETRREHADRSRREIQAAHDAAASGVLVVLPGVSVTVAVPAACQRPAAGREPERPVGVQPQPSGAVHALEEHGAGAVRGEFQDAVLAALCHEHVASRARRDAVRVAEAAVEHAGLAAIRGGAVHPARAGARHQPGAVGGEGQVGRVGDAGRHDGGEHGGRREGLLLPVRGRLRLV